MPRKDISRKARPQTRTVTTFRRSQSPHHLDLIIRVGQRLVASHPPPASDGHVRSSILAIVPIKPSRPPNPQNLAHRTAENPAFEARLAARAIKCINSKQLLQNDAQNKAGESEIGESSPVSPRLPYARKTSPATSPFASSAVRFRLSNRSVRETCLLNAETLKPPCAAASLIPAPKEVASSQFRPPKTPSSPSATLDLTAIGVPDHLLSASLLVFRPMHWYGELTASGPAANRSRRTRSSVTRRLDFDDFLRHPCTHLPTHLPPRAAVTGGSTCQARTPSSLLMTSTPWDSCRPPAIPVRGLPV